MEKIRECVPATNVAGFAAGLRGDGGVCGGGARGGIGVCAAGVGFATTELCGEVGQRGFMVSIRVDAGEAFTEAGGTEASYGFGGVTLTGGEAVVLGLRSRWLSHG